jgi:hypothetical protein
VTERILLALPDSVRRKIWQHLLPRSSPLEQVAFGYATWERSNHVFHLVDWYPVPPEGFAVQTQVFFELTDAARAEAIKQAHDLGTSLIEFHSHRIGSIAQFSPSDLAGLADFVPHVWWRLRARPYLAVVVARPGFDGIAWISGPNMDIHLHGIVADGRISRAASLSRSWGPAYEY